jgi:hypothetical protein
MSDAHAEPRAALATQRCVDDEQNESLSQMRFIEHAAPASP